MCWGNVVLLLSCHRVGRPGPMAQWRGPARENDICSRWPASSRSPCWSRTVRKRTQAGNGEGNVPISHLPPWPRWLREQGLSLVTKGGGGDTSPVWSPALRGGFGPGGGQCPESPTTKRSGSSHGWGLRRGQVVGKKGPLCSMGLAKSKWRGGTVSGVSWSWRL